MRQSKRELLSKECCHCLRPFSFPLCSYNMTGKEKSIKDFSLCWDIEECPYEKELKERNKILDKLPKHLR